jgi:hypothetical protein
LSNDAKSLRALILAADDRKPVPVEVPEWGGVTVYVKPLSMIEQFELQGDGDNETSGPERSALVIALSVYDESGERVFEPADAAELVRKSVAATKRLSAEIKRLNGLGVSADEKKD